MTDKLRDILTKYNKDQYAINTGSEMHKKMRFVNMLNAEDEVVIQIKKHPELAKFFFAKCKNRSAACGKNKW